MLEIRDLCYRVEEADGHMEILQNINLTVPDNRFVVITGPNGGGKTTLAKTIMGITPVTSGQILWNGVDITSLSITQRARLGVSYAFQQPPRFKGIRVRDLLGLAAGQNELTRDEGCRYLTKVGLCADDYIDREVDASLSGGEVKRIEIATILARGSGLMIFDEPEAGIDLWSFAKLTETFHAIHASHTATLMVISHQERILDLADEIVVVSGGKIAQHGPKDEILPHILSDTAAGCCYMRGGLRNERNGIKVAPRDC
ncbi:MAG: ATP-binding cassette domain-containing protein [Clostridia bacterium]|jgi:Fe-S cluster assembly ATP-binding protein|nr:ATP-binding cassette domain-containing protein [Clostridia bacterium]